MKLGYKCLIIKNKNTIKYLKSCKSKAVHNINNDIRTLKRKNRILRFSQLITLLKSVKDRM